MNIHLFRWYS